MIPVRDLPAIAVRAAGPADAAAVSEVLQSSYPALLGTAYDRTLLARILPAMTRANPALLRSGTYYLAEAGPEPVGCGGWTFEKPHSTEAVEGVAHIRHFATAARWVGCGIGRLLYARCERDARTAGVRAFEAYATLNGEPFYRALGFTVIGPMQVGLGGGLFLPAVHMRRMLESRP